MSELTETGSCPRPTPIYNLSMVSMIWNIPVGQLGLLAWLCSLPAPAHLLISQAQKLKKVTDFLATTENISVLSTLF